MDIKYHQECVFHARPHFLMYFIVFIFSWDRVRNFVRIIMRSFSFRHMFRVLYGFCVLLLRYGVYEFVWGGF